jgi:REP element-mobilizing transposase RayT
MNNSYSLSHTTRDCKYHLIWIPKYRKKYYSEILENILVTFSENYRYKKNPKY